VQSHRVARILSPQKHVKWWSILQERTIAKGRKREYTPSPHLPPLQKVSQVEMEAGDCEGRLPPLFGLVIGPSSVDS
jgi:hypothetical protein